MDFVAALLFPEPDYLERIYNKNIGFEQVFEKLFDSLEKFQYGNEVRCDKMDSFYVFEDIKNMLSVIENSMIVNDKFSYSKMDKMRNILEQVEDRIAVK